MLCRAVACAKVMRLFKSLVHFYLNFGYIQQIKGDNHKIAT